MRLVIAISMVALPLAHRFWLHLKFEGKLKVLEGNEFQKRYFPDLIKDLRFILGTRWYHVSFPAIGTLVLFMYFLDWQAGVLA